MRKLVLIGATLTTLTVCCFIVEKQFGQTKAISKDQIVRDRDEEDEEGEKEDGIRLAQEQEFNATKDLTLGYVPKSRLIATSEQLATQRRAMRSAASLRTAGLTWIERGPNTDAIGGSNSNTRGPGSTAATSGRVRAIWVDLLDATNKTVWVGGVDGGVWKTTDITASPAVWTPVNDFLGNLAIASITQDPINKNIMYFGTGEKSINLDAVQGGGIWKSTDHGVTWTLLPSTTSFWNVSKLACDGSGNVYAATIGNGKGVQRSIDGGVTWTNITPSGLNTAVTDMKISSTGRLHIVCGYFNGAFSANSSGYRYTDNPSTVTASTWTAPATTFPTAYNAEIATSGNSLYALPADVNYETPTVYKSTDGGANWAACTSNPPTNSGNSSLDLSSGQGWYNIAIGVDPNNANNVVVGGLNTYRSTDGGANWTEVAQWVGTTMAYVHADQHFVTWKGNQVLIGSDGGIFYSANSGATWADRNTGLRIKQFYSCAIHPTQTDYFIAGAQDNGMHQMNHPGLGGSTEFIGGDGFFGHIDQDQPQYQFGSYVYNVYRRSTDGGNTWSTVTYSSNTGLFNNPSDYDDYNNRMYAAGDGGQYVRWDNPQTGNTFSAVNVSAFSGSYATHVMVSPYTGNRVFFGTDGGKVVRVDNADLNTPTGADITGSGMTAGATVSCVAVGTDDNNLLATFSNYGAKHVWVTTSGGGTSGWTDISGNLPDIPVRWAMFYPYDNTKAILATEAGIFETSSINGAATLWTQNPNFPIVRTDMLQYRPSDGLVLAATHGRGLWSAQIPVANTYVQYSATALNRPESTPATVTSACSGYTDYTVYVKTNRAPSGTATATFTLGSGTAVRGVDFDFTTNGSFTTPSNTVTLASGSTTPQPITIRIYDNANTEAVSSRNFTLTYALSGTTDAVPLPGGQTFTFTISDDDLAPTATVTLNATLGNYDYNLGSSTSGQPFNATLQANRSQMLYKASELTAAGFSAGNITSIGFMMTKNSTRPYTNFRIKIGATSTTYLVNGGVTAASTTTYKTLASYSTVNGLNTFVLDAPYTWDGTSNLVIEVCYDNTTADASNFADILQGYSDGGTSTQGNMIWQNGINCSTGFSSVGYYGTGIKPRIIITGAALGNVIETTLSTSKSLNEGGSNDVYYYNGSKIMARIQNASAFNYGCTQVTIDRAGNGATAFWNNNPVNYLANKTFRVVPTTNNASGQYQITLYYTAAEKAAWEAATGQSWNNIKLIKVKSQISNYTPATPAPDGANAVDIVTPTLGTFGSDYTVTGTFTSGFSGFGVGIPGVNPLPITLLKFEGSLVNNSALLTWSTSSEQNSKSFDVEKSMDGSNFYKIGSLTAAGTSSTRKDYSLRDQQLSPLNYYRLRMNDLDGHFKYSNVVLINYSSAVQKVTVVNNPFNDYLDVRFAKQGAKAKLELVGVTGTVLAQKQIVNPSGQVHWQLPYDISAGHYVLRTTVDGDVFTTKLIKQ